VTLLARALTTFAASRAALTAALLLLLPPILHAQPAPRAKPTIVLVHGAFAESSSWNRVTRKLLDKGYPVLAVANPLRSVKSDATYLASLIDSIPGSVILVGHSYGGTVISVAATGKVNVRALVYVSGVAPDVGETTAGLVGKFPGSTLGPTLAPPVIPADGNKDLYIAQDKFHAQFAADLSADESRLMATTQRPIPEAALNEPVGEPAWKTIPSRFLYGSLDKNIPPRVHAFMAKRAGAKEVVEIQGASHVVMMSHPQALANLIERARSWARPAMNNYSIALPRTYIED
jgi:pimeloyl-ACP methyl ester carboxylesterase